ncbi:MAG: hypothetical protein GXO22_05720 [Aquificae bacterium]|nr:hypothetical protein [Aquificota bacterium]
MKVETLIDKLIKKLEEEKEALLYTLKDKTYSEKLLGIVEEKKELISKLSTYSKEDFVGLEDRLEKVKHLSQENMIFAMNNIQFIEDIFEAVFKQEIKTYSSKGDISKESKSLINKKI